MILGLKSGTVALVDYEPEWESIAAQTIEQLWIVFGASAKDIQHIGSTAIKGIKAKPLIDIAVCVTSFEDLTDVFPRLEEMGVYKSVNQPLTGIVLCSIKKERQSNTLMHVHIVEIDSVQWHNHINFRDYMNKFPKRAVEYEALKIELAEQFPDNRDAYTYGKKKFIEECLHEALIIKKMQQKFDNAPLTLLFGTSNSGKLNAMRKHLAGLNVNIIGLSDIDIKLPEIDESGNNPLENAKVKAQAYYRATGISVFSCDSGLYIKGAPDELQPGVHIRNIGGKYLDDEEMIEYYGKLAQRFGGQMTVRYKNGICFVRSETEIYEYMGDDIAGEEFIITSKPHPCRTKGFPLDSLSVHINTGKYYFDLDKLKDRSSMDEGFRNFFIRTLGL